MAASMCDVFSFCVGVAGRARVAVEVRFVSSAKVRPRRTVPGYPHPARPWRQPHRTPCLESRGSSAARALRPVFGSGPGGYLSPRAGFRGGHAVGPPEPAEFPCASPAPVEPGLSASGAGERQAGGHYCWVLGAVGGTCWAGGAAVQKGLGPQGTF